MFKVLHHPKLHLYILASAFIFFTGFGIAYFLNPPEESIPFDFVGSPIYYMTDFEIFQSVIIKNLIATFLIISLGILNLGIMTYIGACAHIDISKEIKNLEQKLLNIISRIIPISAILVNGYVLGRTIFILNYNPEIVFSTIFPHGYIEFPLLILTGAFALILIDELQTTGLNAYTLLTHHNNPNVRSILKNYLFYPYLLLIPGLLIAALIESTISAWSLRSVLGI